MNAKYIFNILGTLLFISIFAQLASQNQNFGLGGGLQFFIQNPTQYMTPMFDISLPH